MIDSYDPLGLLSRVPGIRRARAYRLYTSGGKRLVDLWQYGGRAILGHTPSGVLLALKDVASRGLSCPFPGPYVVRLERTLSTLVAGYPIVRVYADVSSAERAIAVAGFDALAFRSAGDPALSESDSAATCSLWRPWLPGTSTPILVPVLPFPWPGSPVVLLLNISVLNRFPSSSVVSSVILAAAHRVAADLLAELPRRIPSDFERFDAAIGAGSPAVLRRGPYLRFVASRDPKLYADLFGRALRLGFLLPPDPALPAILPPDLSPGETAALTSFLKSLCDNGHE